MARLLLANLAGLETRRYCRLMAYLESASGNADAAQRWFEKSLDAPDGLPGAAPALLMGPASPGPAA